MCNEYDAVVDTPDAERAYAAFAEAGQAEACMNRIIAKLSMISRENRTSDVERMLRQSQEVSESVHKMFMSMSGMYSSVIGSIRDAEDSRHNEIVERGVGN